MNRIEIQDWIGEVLSNSEPHLMQRISAISQETIQGFCRLASGDFICGLRGGSWGMVSMKKETAAMRLSAQKTYGCLSALMAFPDGTWASGTKSGVIQVWDESLSNILKIGYYSKEQTEVPVCVAETNNWVLCMANYPREGSNVFCIGLPRFLQLWDRESKKVIASVYAGKNDWIRRVDAIARKQLLLIVGKSLQHWVISNDSESQKTSLLPKDPKKQEHVTNFKRFKENQNRVCCSLLNSAVCVLDIEKQAKVCLLKGHEGRIWDIEILEEGFIASCSDDETVRLWDIRQKNQSIVLKELQVE